MKCLKSDVINRATELELGMPPEQVISRIKRDFLKENYPTGVQVRKNKVFLKEVEANEKDWPREALLEQINQMYTFKCKVPTNQKCTADFECPKKNDCQ